MARTKKENNIHTLKDAIDKAYELGLCPKAVHDVDIDIFTSLGLIDLAGSVEQLTVLIAIVHDYLNLCTERQLDLLDGLEDELDKFSDDKKPHYDA